MRRRHSPLTLSANELVLSICFSGLFAHPTSHFREREDSWTAGVKQDRAERGDKNDCGVQDDSKIGQVCNLSLNFFNFESERGATTRVGDEMSPFDGAEVVDS